MLILVIGYLSQFNPEIFPGRLVSCAREQILQAGELENIYEFHLIL
jgi:hypothetical protein